MFDQFDSFIGKKMKEEYRAEYDTLLKGNGYIVTRPDFYRSPDIHINMFLYFDKDFVLTKVAGNKCYAHYSGMYNRSHPVRDREFSKRDMAYLKKFLKNILE